MCVYIYIHISATSEKFGGNFWIPRPLLQRPSGLRCSLLFDSKAPPSPLALSSPSSTPQNRRKYTKYPERPWRTWLSFRGSLMGALKIGAWGTCPQLSTNAYNCRLLRRKLPFQKSPTCYKCAIADDCSQVAESGLKPPFGLSHSCVILAGRLVESWRSIDVVRRDPLPAHYDIPQQIRRNTHWKDSFWVSVEFVF